MGIPDEIHLHWNLSSLKRIYLLFLSLLHVCVPPFCHRKTCPLRSRCLRKCLLRFVWTKVKKKSLDFNDKFMWYFFKGLLFFITMVEIIKHLENCSNFLFQNKNKILRQIMTISLSFLLLFRLSLCYVEAFWTSSSGRGRMVSQVLNNFIFHLIGFNSPNIFYNSKPFYETR